MGKDLAQQFPSARARFEEADTLLGFSLSKLCWEGPLETLTRTAQCQPALYVTSLAALAGLESELKDRNCPLSPASAAGLSLGEYTALAAAGAFSFEEGLRLVRLRGEAMEEASRTFPGTMASVLGLELKALETICSETGAQVANINSPGQIVISGSPEAVLAASARAKEKGAKRAVPLEVGGAFHSRLMAPAGARLKKALETVNVQSLGFSVLSNVTGSYYTDSNQAGALLVAQLTSTVQWEACVRTLLADSVRTFLEVGSGTVLRGLVRRVDPEAQVLPVGTADEVRRAAAAVSQWS